jgi:glycosyltransferase involved in cell wall biosynthesis
MSRGIQQFIDIPFLPLEGIRITLPKVDVVIGNYKQGSFVRDAILSVAQQKYPYFECVIVDDASKDGSGEIIRDVLRDLADERFKFVERPENGGQMATMVTGLEKGKAPFVAFMDADDIWLPSFLETHVACHLNPHINAALSSANLAVIDAQGTLIAGADPGFSICRPTRSYDVAVPIPSIPSLRRDAIEETAESPNIVFAKNYYQRWIWAPTSGLVFRRSVLEIARPSNVLDFRRNADLYWTRFCHVIGGSILMQQVHGYYRLHSSNAFSISTVFGDDYVNGIDPPAVVEATRRTMLEKFITDKTFVNILKPHHFVGTALGLAQTSKEKWALVNASILDAKTSKKLKRKLRQQAIKSALKKPFKIRLGGSNK